MGTIKRGYWFLRFIRLALILCMLFLFMGVPKLHGDDDEFDSYKVRIFGFWAYSNPSGSVQGEGENAQVDLQKDLGFDNYSTFSGKLDWKFTHKNHLYFAVTPFDQSRQTVLSRTITFQGQTFDLGLTTQSSLRVILYAPGYQYDIIRRKRGHLGIAAQIDLFDSKASISAAAQTTGDGVHHEAVSASGSLLAPIPVAGPEFRLYLTNSPRLFIEGNVYGMYLFGYGNFVSSAGTVGFTINKHLSVNGGYQLGTRLIVNNSNDRIGIRLTQKGALVGAEFSF